MPVSANVICISHGFATFPNKGTGTVVKRELDLCLTVIQYLTYLVIVLIAVLHAVVTALFKSVYR